MTKEAMTIGQAIDQILSALESLDERSRKTVMAAVSGHLGIPAIEQPPAHGAPIAGSREPVKDTDELTTKTSKHSSPPVSVVDIRTLKNQKQPQSARQMACLVGYYLQELAPEGERKDTLDASDLEKYFKQAGFPLPGKLSQVLIDCKKSGYIDSVERGVYKLNAVGYNLAVHKLPASGSDK